MSDLDFRGKPLIDKAYNGKANFVEQVPLSEMLPDLEALFAKGVKAIKWHQYVPGWNDGEPCELTIGDIYVTTDPKAAEAWMDNQYYDGPDEEDPYDDYDEGYIPSYAPEHHRDGLLRSECLTPIGDAKYEYAIRAEFGDNAEVVITPDSTYVFDYECGY